jgi:hypothetical protein
MKRGRPFCGHRNLRRHGRARNHAPRPQLWMRLQAAYDLKKAEQNNKIMERVADRACQACRRSSSPTSLLASSKRRSQARPRWLSSRLSITYSPFPSRQPPAPSRSNAKLVNRTQSGGRIRSRLPAPARQAMQTNWLSQKRDEENKALIGLVRPKTPHNPRSNGHHPSLLLS